MPRTAVSARATAAAQDSSPNADRSTSASSPSVENWRAPRTNNNTSTFGRLKNFVHWLYVQYLLVTALYMLEPWERAIFNVIVICLLITCVYSLWAFMIPSTMIFSAPSLLGSIFGRLFGGGEKNQQADL